MTHSCKASKYKIAVLGAVEGPAWVLPHPMFSNCVVHLSPLLLMRRAATCVTLVHANLCTHILV